MQAINYLKALNVQGVDAAAFLNAQLSVNVTSLATGERQLGCWCNAKGQVIATVLVMVVDTDHFLLILSKTLINAVLQRMQMFVLRSQVSLSIANDRQIIVTESDNDSEALWQQLQCITVDTNDQSTIDSNDDVNNSHLARDINDGICWLGPETTQQFLPQMLAMQHFNAVDYKKGCYPGQEVIARAHYLGRVKRRLWRIDVNSDAQSVPENGTLIRNDQNIVSGQIVAAAKRASDTIGLAILHDNHIDTVLSYETNGTCKNITTRYAIGEN